MTGWIVAAIALAVMVGMHARTAWVAMARLNRAHAAEDCIEELEEDHANHIARYQSALGLALAALDDPANVDRGDLNHNLILAWGGPGDGDVLAELELSTDWEVSE